MAIVYINKGEIYKTEQSIDSGSLFMKSLNKDGQRSFYFRDERFDPITDFVAVKRDKDSKIKKQKYYKSTPQARALAGVQNTNTAANIRNTAEGELFDLALALGYYKGDVGFEEVYYHLRDFNHLDIVAHIIGLQNPLTPELIKDAMENKSTWRYGNVGGVDIMVCSIVYIDKKPTMFKVYDFGA